MSGAPVEDASMSVAEWLEDWITTSLVASDREQATTDLCATLARTHLVPTVGTIPRADRDPRMSKRPSSPSGMPACRDRRSGRSTPSSGQHSTSPPATACSVAIPRRP